MAKLQPMVSKRKCVEDILLGSQWCWSVKHRRRGYSIKAFYFVFVFLINFIPVSDRRLVNAFVYYALSFNTNDLSGNSYLNFLLSGLLEFPSYGLLFLGIHRFGRRLTLVSFMMAAGASCIGLLLVPSGEYLKALFLNTCIQQTTASIINNSCTILLFEANLYLFFSVSFLLQESKLQSFLTENSPEGKLRDDV